MAGPNFRRGAEAAQAASKGGAFARTEFFKLEDKGKVFVRFLTDADEWITVDQHQMVPTKPKPDDAEKWPEKMGAVCRKDEAFEGLYPDCYICDHIVDGKKVKRPSGRTWALACIREEVREDGKIVGYRDKIRTVNRPKKDGKEGETEEVKEKDIVVVNMAWKNFFSIMKGFAEFYGTVLDRDYLITRSGDDQGTTYSIIPMDPIVVDDEGTVLDLRNPQFQDRYATDLVLGDVVAERADDEFYARFFDPRYTATKEGKVEPTGKGPEAPKPENDVSEDQLAAMAERVKGYGQAEPNGGATETTKKASAGAARDLG
jgi:hypothetical protein